MKRLVILAPLLAGERENEALEACIANLSSDDIWEDVVLRPGPTEVPNTFEGVGIELKNQGSIFTFTAFILIILTLTVSF